MFSEAQLARKSPCVLGAVATSLNDLARRRVLTSNTAENEKEITPQETINTTLTKTTRNRYIRKGLAGTIVHVPITRVTNILKNTDVVTNPLLLVLSYALSDPGDVSYFL